MYSPASHHQTRALLWKTGGWIIALFWLVQFLELTLVEFVDDGGLASRAIATRAVNVIAGVLLTAPIVEAAARSGGLTFRRRVVGTVCTALAMCVLLMGVNYVTYYVPLFGGGAVFNPTEFIYIGFGWSWFFLGVAGAVVGLSYNLEMRDRERRLAEMEAVAKEARLAALRYQLNPHFLFNTLNSIAALIASGEPGPAETMVESLSEFLRATLELDPVEDITLAQELELQRVYLSIEQERFPERLRARYDISDASRSVRVPALITQPLVENAIRHSVARSTAAVTITMSANVSDGRLLLSIENDGAAAGGEEPRGLGVGLANVRARLESRYGSGQSVRVDRSASGYRVSIELPSEGGS